MTCYQLNWKTLPGLRGVGCSEFRLVETERPDEDRGIAVECTAEESRGLVRELETQFSSERYPNNASAFEAVKAFVLDWRARRAAGPRVATGETHKRD